MDKVAIIAEYCAPVKGQFIRTLESLEKSYKEIIYLFPYSARNNGYMKDWQESHKVYFIRDSVYKTCLKGNIKVIDANAKKEIENILVSENVAIIHSHFDYYDIMVADIARELKLKAFYHFHNPFLDYYDSFGLLKRTILFTLFRRYYNRMLKHGTLISVGQGYYHRLRKLLKHKKDKIVLLENAVDFNYIIPKVEFSDKIKRFLMIGTRMMKGVDHMLKTIDELTNRGFKAFNVSIIVTDETKEFINNYYDNTLPEQVTLLDMFPNMMDALKTCDCFISPSSRENCCYAILEALAYGVPCLVSNIYTNKWCEISKNVEFFELNNVKQLADYIEYYVTTPYDINRNIEGIKFIQKNYNLENWVKNMISIYEGS